ncbi:hypothetical protein [Streptomyces sp. G1]|uniref:hypothetical protein n=1 Tax=Streptomyces sp. G1 TaxID=361572 RepID=UPI002030CF77|nr:hypothetical protein [Streptomyces sp. G1]MCM1966361.1 hypothetical protein [Streptomyces sp. G1]
MFAAVQGLTLSGLNQSPEYSAEPTPSHGTWGDAAYVDTPYEEGIDPMAVLRDGPRHLPAHVLQLLEAHESEPPPPPVPTAATVLIDVSDEVPPEPRRPSEGCVRYR